MTRSDLAPSQAVPPAQYFWRWQQRAYSIAYQSWGQGRPLLLLPAFSTVSSRSEFDSVGQILAAHYRVTSLDWLGFGQSDRPRLDYRPALYRQLLQDFVRDRFTEPVVVVAAGHAAGYALQLAPPPAAVVLVAPTWRGPLPAMGAPAAVAQALRQLVRSPGLGPLLYRANTTPGFLRLMYGRHVYSDPTHLTPALIEQKRRITQAAGARFGPAAFVTGALDPVADRAAFLALVKQVSAPLLAIIAEQAPPKSAQEMAAIAALPAVHSRRQPGMLGQHEEFAEPAAAAILEFLSSQSIARG